ncbi:MAG: patatin-like phospholipase family protein [Bacillota bacterium]
MRWRNKQFLMQIIIVLIAFILIYGVGVRAEQEKPVIALVLGGGAAWGIAHIGVLEKLLEENIEFDIITGTSAGAIVGAFYADGYSIEEMITEVEDLKFRDFLFPVFDELGFFSITRLEEYFDEKISQENIEDLPITMCISTTNIDTGQVEKFTKGPLDKLLAASTSVPIMFAPVEYEDYLLADGGLVDNLPVQAAHELGADIVIAVDVGGNFSFTDRPESKTEYGNRIFNIMRMASYSPEGVDIYIAPKLDGYSGTDFELYSEFIELGREAAEQAMPEIKDLLGLK